MAKKSEKEGRKKTLVDWARGCQNAERTWRT